jgi:hypothetical protein
MYLDVELGGFVLAACCAYVHVKSIAPHVRKGNDYLHVRDSRASSTMPERPGG